MDCFQPTGSFKIRGIGALCEQLARQGAKGFLSSSGGNAGLAVAYAGKHLAIQTTIVVPNTTTERVCERMRALQAKVIRHGDVWDDSDRYARRMALEQGWSYIHPFDNPVLWRGHASLIRELKAQGPKPDILVCSVGGGGLLCGVLEGLYEQNWSDVEVVAVETTGAASLRASVQAGALVSIPAITSIAKTLGARQVASRAYQWTKEHSIHCLEVSDRQALTACMELGDEFQVLVEPACGAAYAALFLAADIVRKAQRISVIVCGGRGVDTDTLLEYKRLLKSD